MIDQSLQSEEAAIREIIWNHNVWQSAFNIYLDQAQTARPKSLRQLLTTLTSALSKASESTTLDPKPAVVDRILVSLSNFEDPQRAKAGAQLLNNLLAKDVLGIDQVLQAYRAASGRRETADSRSILQNFLQVVFRWLSEGDFGSTIAQLTSTLLDKYEVNAALEAAGWKQECVWNDPLINTLESTTVGVDDLRAHLLPILFKRSFDDFVSFLENQGLRSILSTSRDPSVPVTVIHETRSEDLLYAALQTGKELGLLLETEGKQMERSTKSLHVPIIAAEILLTRGSASARLTAFSFLVSSHSATRPLPEAALKLIKRNLNIFFADVDADFRSDVFSLFQRLIDRIRAATAFLARQSTQTNIDPETKKSSESTLKHHREFLAWLIQFLQWEFRPTASYQRHISALKCLLILARSGLDERVPKGSWSKNALGDTKWAFEMPIMSKDLQGILLELLSDPFDDVRQISASILSLYSGTPDTLFHEQIEEALDHAEEMMLLTSRADHADGVAHLYALAASNVPTPASSVFSNNAIVQRLVKKLEGTVETAYRDIGEAVEKYPMHGILTSLRYVMNQSQFSELEPLQNHLLELLNQVWEVVKPVLCNDAPEGYLPEELDEGPDSSKETLSYCWRALKEASLLMSTMISQTKDDHVLEKIAFLCFTQLAQLRHRGAFSTVAQTWSACCTRCSGLKSPEGETYLALWYTNILEMLRNNVTINTRRSAGLPALLCGILIADKSGSMVDSAMRDLDAISRAEVDASDAEKGSLPQVHAMNCIKDILKNTRLGEHSERYIPFSLRLATDALRSSVWAIRNCGLMLFRAVIDRLLGTSEAHFDDSTASHKRISLEHYPEVLDVVFELLAPRVGSEGDTVIANEGVFPALQLLQHSRVPNNTLEKFKLAVSKLTGNSSWHVRNKAAKAFASLVEPEYAALEAAALLETPWREHNSLHGALLCTRYIIMQLGATLQRESAHVQMDSLMDDIQGVLGLSLKIFRNSKCRFIQAACVDCQSEVTKLLSGLSKDLFGNIAVERIQPVAELTTSVLEDPSAASLRQALARLAARLLAENGASLADVAENILRLARFDENACSYFLQEVTVDGSESHAQKERLLDICSQIRQADCGADLKCTAQDLLLRLNSVRATGAESWPNKAALLSNKETNLRLIDGDLELQAQNLSAVMESHELTNTAIASRIVAWADSCSRAAADQGIHSRDAAARSLQRVSPALWQALHAHPELDQSFLDLSLAVYELLNDDDEETRLLAAAVCGRILIVAGAHDSSEPDIEPITASQELLQYCARRWKSSPEFFRHAFAHAFAIEVPVAEQLTKLSHADVALFAAEKQNLYIDDAREVRVWSQVVTRLAPSAIERARLAALGTWVLDGLGALSTHPVRTATARAEVFTLGLTVLYGAEVLLRLGSVGVPLSVRPSDLKAALIAWMTAEQKRSPAGGNALWRREIERVLQDAIRLKLGSLNTVLEDALASCGPGV